MSADKDRFAADGFLVLKSFFAASVVDTTLTAALQRIKSKPHDLVIDNMDTGVRSTLAMTPSSEFNAHRFKVSDLHLTVGEVRALALAPDIVRILCDLLGDAPVLCNSLYFEKGSAQPAHVDSLYMTPKTPGHLIAIWVALEDAHEDAGQLEYFPGSHRIEQMKFSNGGYHSIPAEMSKWFDYITADVERRGLVKERFAALKGDTFIWHAHLLHGGGPIADPSKTRRSFVFHYYSASDCRGPALRRAGEGFWLDRPPQPVGQLAADYEGFSDAFYLAQYPDVDQALAGGEIESAWAHYYAFGQHEGRCGVFPEAAYMDRYPDVGIAVQAGQFKSGLDHYLKFGRREGRSA